MLENENPYLDGTAPWVDWNLGWRIATQEAAMNTNREIAREATEGTPEEMGQAAAGLGLDANANPYHFGNPAHHRWLLSWAKEKRAS